MATSETGFHARHGFGVHAEARVIYASWVFVALSWLWTAAAAHGGRATRLTAQHAPGNHAAGMDRSGRVGSDSDRDYRDCGELHWQSSHPCGLQSCLDGILASTTELLHRGIRMEERIAHGLHWLVLFLRRKRALWKNALLRVALVTRRVIYLWPWCQDELYSYGPGPKTSGVSAGHFREDNTPNIDIDGWHGNPSVAPAVT